MIEAGGYSLLFVQGSIALFARCRFFDAQQEQPVAGCWVTYAIANKIKVL